MYRYNSTIASITRIKAAYQPNLIKAWVIVITLCVTLTLLVFWNESSWNSDAKRGFTVNEGSQISEKIQVYSNNSQTISETAALSSDRHRAAQHGFAGFRRYEVIRERGRTKSKINVAENISEDDFLAEKIPVGDLADYAPTPENNSDIIIDGSNVGDIDFGLPSSDRFMPTTNRGLAGLEHAFGEIVSPSSKAEILLPSPLWPIIANREKTGVVTVLLTINQDKTISWIRISEEPRGQGFAASLENALILGNYKPPIINGVPQAITVLITMTFCHNCENSIKSITGNIYAALLDR